MYVLHLFTISETSMTNVLLKKPSNTEDTIENNLNCFSKYNSKLLINLFRNIY
jgi:hypothetical protein